MNTTEKQNAKKQDMLDALRRARNDIACMTNWLEMELGHYDDDEIADFPESYDWATVGTLQKVRSDLMETLRFFAGFETTEDIQRSLDEMNE